MKKILAVALAALLAAAVPARARMAASAPELYTAEGDGSSAGRETALSLHKLNYAVLGNDDLKLQYSFKYRLVDRASFFFAYTNVILWEIYEPSIPLKDIIFNPEAFYRLKEEKSWLVTLDAGYFHLSNGRGAADSRALDRLFARVQKSSTLLGRPWFLTVQVFPVVLESGTGDYARYVGWWDASLWIRNVLGQKRSGLDLQLERTAGPGGHPWRRGSSLVGLQYQVVDWPRLNPSLYVQWFEGHGEMMIDFTRRVDELRAGISWLY